MWTKTIQPDPETLATFRKILIRSTSYSISAYFISILVEWTLLSIGAWLRGYEVNLFYNRIKITAGAGEWDQEAVMLIYLIPFLIQAVVAIILYLKFSNIALTPHYSRIFMLWLMFFINYRILGIFSSHLVSHTGIYHAFHWLYVDNFIIIMAGILTAIVFFATARQILKAIILFAGTYNNHVRDMGVANLVLSSVVYPVLFVSLVALVFFLPKPPLEEITGLAFVLFITGSVYLSMQKTDPVIFSYKEKPAEKANPVKMLTVILIFVVALRVFLEIELLQF